MDNEFNVAHYVSELLFRHDCVVVPGFGAFVCTYAPARVHPAQHTFTPPSKQIVFNKHLQQNDGLLAQTIATGTSCDFETAMAGITKYVEEVNGRLKGGSKVELHNLGTLSLDPERNISFEPFPEINYLIDSFGLASFQSMPIIREETAEKRKPVERVDRTVAEETRKTPVPRRVRTRRVLITSAIVLPVLAAAFWFTSQNTNALAGLGFFGKNKPSTYQPVKWLKQEKSVADPSEEIKADSNGIAQLSLIDNAPPMVVDIHKVMPESTNVVLNGGAQLPQQASYSSGKRYYVIGGAFEVQQNAENYIRTLTAKGYKPIVLDKVRSRLTHISVASFASKTEAIEFLNTVKGDMPGAWLLKK